MRMPPSFLRATTLLSQNSSNLLTRVSKFLDSTSTSSVLLFTLSATTDLSSLSSIIDRLTTHPSNIGCISAPPAGDSVISCSLTVFDAKHAIPFRSTIPGTEAPQVGRWHAHRRVRSGQEGKDVLEDRPDWQAVWDREGRSKPPSLPSGLSSLQPHDVGTVMFLSDGASEGLSHSLSYFPDAQKLGLFASSTPFVTGRPVTLFHNNEIHSSGAVGIALSHNLKPKATLDFPGLRAITPSLTVTQSEGNLVNELDSSNAARLVLAAVQKGGFYDKTTIKEDEFFLGVVGDDDQPIHQLYRISSGDPSRGNIALETNVAPKAGTSIQIYHRSDSGLTSHPVFLIPDAAELNNSLTFMAAPPLGAEVQGARVTKNEEDVLELKSRFIACSENGFSVSRGGEAAWRSTVPGGYVNVRWLQASAGL